jgi:polyhydroxybutyrate depolymerase
MDTDASCHPTRPVGALQIHGDKDTVIRYSGGTNNGATYTSAQQTANSWRRLNGCPDTAGRSGPPLDADERVPGDDLRSTTWSGCRNGTAVGLWTIVGGDHQPILTAAFATSLVAWLDDHRRTS